jgi:hypothetical protein
MREGIQLEEVVKVMKAPERDHKTVLTADAERVDAPETLIVTPGEKQNGDVSKALPELKGFRESVQRGKEIGSAAPRDPRHDSNAGVVQLAGWLPRFC